MEHFYGDEWMVEIEGTELSRRDDCGSARGQSFCPDWGSATSVNVENSKVFISTLKNSMKKKTGKICEVQPWPVIKEFGKEILGEKEKR